MTNQTNAAMTDEQRQQQDLRWNQEQSIKVQKFCLSKGVQPKRLVQPKCQCLPPLLGVWYLESSEKGQDYWVISGELPTDLVDAKVADNARKAIRHFSLNWQLKAANLEAELQANKVPASLIETNQKLARELMVKAESLYELSINDKLWKESGFSL